MCIAILRPVCTFHFVHFSIHTIPYSVLYWCALYLGYFLINWEIFPKLKCYTVVSMCLFVWVTCSFLFPYGSIFIMHIVYRYMYRFVNGFGYSYTCEW